MDRSNTTSRTGILGKRLVLAAVAAMAAVACGADRITEPGTNSLHGPPTRPPLQQPERTPPRFGPARPSFETPAVFTPDMPFGRAIEILRHCTQPPLNIVVLWRELEDNAGVDRNTPIGIDGLRGIRLRQCLEVLLTSISATAATRVGYTVNHGVITIATIDSLPRPKPVARVYDISDLVAPPSTGIGFGTMSGMMGGLGGLGYGGNGGYGGYGSYGGLGSGLGGYAPGGYGGYSPGYGLGYGNNGSAQGYGPLGGLPGFIGGFQGSGVYAR